ncbi:MAG: methionine ABC transporter permease [Eubacteriales bacterium]|nr:methionine ABC transporter permease [Eubacteriales bacterium]
MTFSPQIIELIQSGIGETLCMVFISTAVSYLIGIPLGIILVVGDKDGIYPMPVLQKVLGVAINLLRSVPFLILLIMMIPVTRRIVGTSLGWKAVVPPLVAAAAPYIARMVESSFKEIDAGVIEAAKSMGASTFQIIWKVLLPESKPSLLVGAAISTTTILGYSAMAGAVGGGGLGGIAINYGYYRYEVDMMFLTVAILVIIVQIIQEAGMKLARVSDKRIR